MTFYSTIILITVRKKHILFWLHKQLFVSKVKPADKIIHI